MKLSQEAEYMIIHLLKKRVSELESVYKENYTEAMRAGERKAVYVQLDDGEEVDLGGITRSKPTATWKVTQPNVLGEWVRANRPDLVETLTVVPDRHIADLLASAKKQGAAVTDEGEEIPGIEEVTGSSYVAPKPGPDALEQVEGMVSTGALQWNQIMPRIGAGS